MNVTVESPEQPLEITLIVAMDQDGVIGAGGGMPWHIPDDLQWFKRHTLDKPILMGRRTFDAIGRALPRRRNLVLTRDSGFRGAGCERVASLEAAIDIAKNEAADELMVIGGAQVYALALARANCLRITQIEAHFQGDTWFPEVDWRYWRLVDERAVAAVPDVLAHRFMTWRRLY